MSDHDVSKMKVADLKVELKKRGLSTLGNKTELVDRLQGALIDGGDPLEDTAISEDLLEDDELNDDILEEEEDKNADGTVEEDQMLKSPTPSEASKSESPEQLKEQLSKSSEHLPSAAAVPQKKVSLKRNISISVPTAAAATPSATTGTEEDKKAEPNTEGKNGTEQKSDEPEKKIVKLNQMTAQERLEMRAKKFGAVPTSDSKLQARAARFGLETESDSAASTGSASTVSNLEALKKRAERFGVSVSDKMTKIDQLEKLQKRQERFGTAASTTSASTGNPKLTATGKVAITASSSSTDYAERARLRLERFKNTA